MAIGSKRLAAPLVALSTCLMQSACGDDATQVRKPTNDTRAAMASDGKSGNWLELKSDISPAQWLVSRGESRIRSETDPLVQRVAADLASAHAIYRESHRMIANRTVQLQGMLKSIGIEQDAPSILADLLSVPGEIGQTEGFGAVTQHYFNLRSANNGREAALAELKGRYGPRKLAP